MGLKPADATIAALEALASDLAVRITSAVSSGR